MRAIALAIVLGLAASAAGCLSANTGAPFDVAGEPSGDVNSIASRCVGADTPGQTVATFEMKFPHCSGM